MTKTNKKTNKPHPPSPQESYYVHEECIIIFLKNNYPKTHKNLYLKLNWSLFNTWNNCWILIAVYYFHWTWIWAKSVKISSFRRYQGYHDCYERPFFGGRAGGTQSSWLVTSVGLASGSWSVSDLGGTGGGIRLTPLFGSLGGIGGAVLSRWANGKNPSDVTALGGSWGGLWEFKDICRRTGDVAFSVNPSGPFTVAARGFRGGTTGGEGSFSGKFSMLT